MIHFIKDNPVLVVSIIMVLGSIAWIALFFFLNRKCDPFFGYFMELSVYEGKKLLFTINGHLKIAVMKLKKRQFAVGKLKFVDKDGDATDVPNGNVTVEVVPLDGEGQDEVATAEYNDEKNEITVKSVEPGVAALKISATNAAGEQLPFEDVAIEVTAGDAVSGTIEFGEPQDIPEGQ